MLGPVRHGWPREGCGANGRSLERSKAFAGRVVPVGRARGITEDTAKRLPLAEIYHTCSLSFEGNAPWVGGGNDGERAPMPV